MVAVCVYCNAVLGSPVYTSSVYVKRGPQRSVPAVEYVEYAPPAVSVPGPQYAPLGVPPVVPYTSGYQPCISPCVIERVDALPQLQTPNTNIVTYQQPKIAIVPRTGEVNIVKIGHYRIVNIDDLWHYEKKNLFYKCTKLFLGVRGV